MIITLTKAHFSSCKIGTLTTFNVRKSTTIGATVNIIKTSVERAGYSSATTIATIILDEANYEGHAIKVMMGSTDVSSWYSVGNVIVPANTPITSNITISVSATAVSGGDPIIPDEPEQPGTGGGSGENPTIPTTETWYIDHRNNVSKFSASVNIAGRGWCHIPNSDGYNAIVGKPINTIGVITNLETQNITIGVVTYKGKDTDMRTVGTYTLTNPNGTTKSFVSCKIDEVTLNNNECLVLYAQEDDSIQFYYLSSGGPVTDANGIADGNFAGTLGKVYGSGSAWTEYTNGLTLGISYGYIPE
jgi:hypothetical protein